MIENYWLACLGGGLLVLCSACSTVTPSTAESSVTEVAQNKTYAMKASISVEIVGATLVVNTQYKNLSSQLIYIKKGLFGVRPQGSGTLPSRGAVDEFTIKVRHGHFLQYAGILINFVEPYTKEENFTPMAPGEIRASSVRLGPEPSGPQKGQYAYAFLSGTHEYEITTRYMIFDEQENAIKILHSDPATFTLTLP